MIVKAEFIVYRRAVGYVFELFKLAERDVTAAVGRTVGKAVSIRSVFAVHAACRRHIAVYRVVFRAVISYFPAFGSIDDLKLHRDYIVNPVDVEFRRKRVVFAVIADNQRYGERADVDGIAVRSVCENVIFTCSVGAETREHSQPRIAACGYVIARIIEVVIFFVIPRYGIYGVLRHNVYLARVCKRVVCVIQRRGERIFARVSEFACLTRYRIRQYGFVERGYGIGYGSERFRAARRLIGTIISERFFRPYHGQRFGRYSEIDLTFAAEHIVIRSYRNNDVISARVRRSGSERRAVYRIIRISYDYIAAIAERIVTVKLVHARNGNFASSVVKFERIAVRYIGFESHSALADCQRAFVHCKRIVAEVYRPFGAFAAEREVNIIAVRAAALSVKRAERIRFEEADTVKRFAFAERYFRAELGQAVAVSRRFVVYRDGDVSAIDEICASAVRQFVVVPFELRFKRSGYKIPSVAVIFEFARVGCELNFGIVHVGVRSLNYIALFFSVIGITIGSVPTYGNGLFVYRESTRI